MNDQENNINQEQESEKNQSYATKNFGDTTTTEENTSKYKEGEVLTFVKVRFPGHTKSYPFVIGKRKVAYGQKVVALSDRGMTVGYINSFPYKLPYSADLEPVKTLNKIASEQDIENQKQHYRREKEVETLKNLIEEVFTQVSQPLNVIGTASNGETFYEKA